MSKRKIDHKDKSQERMNSGQLRAGKRKRPQQFDDMFSTPLADAGFISPFKSLKLSPIAEMSAERSGSCRKMRHQRAFDIYSDTSSSESEVNVSRLSNQPAPCPAETGPALKLGEHQPTMLEAYRGQLKVSVYINYGLLTVHVVQGKQLRSKRSDTCDPFIKLSLVPDESERTICQTEVFPESNAPLFDEKFSFELLEEDLKRRLLVTVWNHSTGIESDEFLGCMSFGIKKIHREKKTVSGWYFLLPEEVGKYKHLQAPERKQNLTERSSNIPQINQDLLWMDTHILVIKKGPRSFGFTVTGSCPVMVCRTEPGGQANQAGLRKDDCIVRINGLNVSRSTSDSVARIIKHSEKQIVLEVQRPQVLQSFNQAPQKPEPVKKEEPVKCQKKKTLKRFGSLRLLLWNKDKENKDSGKSKSQSQDKENKDSKVKVSSKDKENKESSTKPKLSSSGGSTTSVFSWKNMQMGNIGNSLQKGTFSSSTLPRNFGKKSGGQQTQSKPRTMNQPSYPSSWLDIDQSQLYKSSSSCSSSSSTGAWMDSSRDFGHRGFQRWDFGPHESTHISQVEPRKSSSGSRKRVSFQLSPQKQLPRIIEQPTLQDLPELEPGMTWV